MRTPGERICASLRQAAPGVPLVHLHPGPVGTSSAADVVITAPFNPRKVVKTLERLLSEQDEGMLIYGPFAMSLKRGTLIVNGLETPLTPKQAALIEVFLLNPGEVVSRKMLMEKVWQTDYMGDTRTLNVHIRWIRQTIEPNPSQPRYLRTVRGIGYCLSVSAEDDEADDNETANL